MAADRPGAHQKTIGADKTYETKGFVVEMRQFRLRGTGKVNAVFGLHVIVYNLIRFSNLLSPAMAAA